MSNDVSVATRGSWGKRFLKVALRVIVLLIVLLWVVQTIFRFSGSNQWELVGEKNGAKVYGLKQPGTTMKQYKAIGRVRSTMPGFVKWLQDPDACTEIGCTESKVIERVDDQLQYVSFRFPADMFDAREFVLRVQSHQNPSTKEVWVEYDAVPDKIPANSCCVRVTSMNNTWRLKPLGNGEIEWEYDINMNEGGYLPDALLNTFRPKYLFIQGKKMQKYLDKPKYQEAQFDFIK